MESNDSAEYLTCFPDGKTDGGLARPEAGTRRAAVVFAIVSLDAVLERDSECTSNFTRLDLRELLNTVHSKNTMARQTTLDVLPLAVPGIAGFGASAASAHSEAGRLAGVICHSASVPFSFLRF